MSVSRREFLGRVSFGAAVAGLLGRRAAGASGSGDGELPIVDTHQHLWDLSRLRLPWLKPGTPLCRSFLMKDYLEATRGLNVVKAVYMEVAVADEDLVAEAEYVIELCRRKDNPTVAAVIGGRPASSGFRDYIMRFKDNPYVKGVRHIPSPAKGDAFLYRQESFVAGIRLLGELGMSFDLCMPPQHLPDAIRLVDRCPDTRFIVDHCGNADPKAFWTKARRAEHPTAGAGAHDPDQWRRDLAELAKRDRVVCKISGIVARVPKGNWKPDDLAPIINHCLDVFGPDRVIFASDWPVCTRGAALREWVAALKHVVRARSEQERRKLFAENAIRFYGLAS